MSTELHLPTPHRLQFSECIKSSYTLRLDGRRPDYIAQASCDAGEIVNAAVALVPARASAPLTCWRRRVGLLIPREGPAISGARSLSATGPPP